MAGRLSFRILGSFEVECDDAPIQVGTQMERALLADLLLHAGETVSIGKLAEDLWDGEAPARAKATIRVYVSHLRRALKDAGGGDLLETKTPGYRLNVAADAIDASRFEQLAADGRKLLIDGDAAGASSTLREALSLWRGDALADLADRSFARATATRLAEARQQAHEARIEADLSLRRHAELTAELDELAGRHPLRESVWALRIRALYGAGRQADALAAYRALKQRLVNELGIDPSPDLQRLERAVLAQDPSLVPAQQDRLPSGTVTFLMTDIEGSAALWEEDANAMSAAMVRHDSIIVEQIAANNGVVIGARGEGDSQFCVFQDPADALRAAVDIQRQLAAEPWSTPRPVTVRIAIYTGDAHQRDGDYYGTAPNRGARLRDLGHGGQILVSSATVDALAEPPEGIDLEPLGAYQLRGIKRSEPVFQLHHPLLSASFPELRATHLGRLPQPLTSFVGRDDETKRLTALLEERRLVTLTGAAGVGKTRLAIQAAHSLRPTFEGGVWFVELAPVTDPDQLERAIITAFDLTETAGRSAGQVLDDFIRERRMLIILDNCEHVIDASARIAQRILDVAPACHLLTTSRETLGIAGEATWRVTSLPVPPTDSVTASDLEDFEAIDLFCARARDADATFAIDDRSAAAVARICRRLDGIPLAIELAAGRINIMSVEDIAQKLEHQFELLTGGPRTAVERQQTMRAAIDWSYQHLSPAERTVLSRLGVFVGGFSLDAARSVCATNELRPSDIDEHVGGLVRKSMVMREPGSRFRLLESIRTYAQEQLGRDRASKEVRDAHLGHFSRLVKGAGGATGPEVETWIEMLDPDRDNLLAALRHAAAVGKERGLSLLAETSAYWRGRGYGNLIRDLTEALLSDPPDHASPDRARVISLLGTIALNLGDYEEAETRLTAAQGMFAAHADRAWAARAKTQLAQVAFRRGDLDRAYDLGTEALDVATDLDDEVLSILPLEVRGFVEQMRGDQGAARATFHRALEIARNSGHRRSVGAMIGHLGASAGLEGDLDEARGCFLQALEIAREVRDWPNVAWQCARLGSVNTSLGDHAEALPYLEESLAMAREMGERQTILRSLGTLAIAHHELGEFEAARKAIEEAIDIARGLDEDTVLGEGYSILGMIEADDGRLDLAWDHHTTAIEILRRVSDLSDVEAVPRAVAAVRRVGFLAATSNDPGAAAMFLSASSSLAPGSSESGDQGASRASAMMEELTERLGARSEEARARGSELDVEGALSAALDFLVRKVT